MKYLPVRARIRGLFAVISAAASVSLAGCNGSGPTEPHGSPVLTKVYWIVGQSSYLAWSKEPDALVSPVPPGASQIDFVFDRRLDGNRIEDVITVNGVMTAVPKDPPPVRVSWPNMAATAATAPFSLTVSYDVIPRYGSGTALVFARPATPGFPSDSTVTFTLVPTQLTSAYGEPATVPDSIPVKTAALTVSIGGSSGAVAPSAQVSLGASNRLAAPPAQSPFVHVSANGADVPYKLLADVNLSSRWFLAPADCLGGVWPAATTFTITIDTGFADAFGGKLKQPVTGTFSTSAGSSGVDASCSISDGGPADAGDAAVSIDAAADAAPGDAGGDAATGDAGTDAADPDGGVAADAADAGLG